MIALDLSSLIDIVTHMELSYKRLNMKYNLEIEIPEKYTTKAVLVRMPEPVYREFSHAIQEQGTTMTRVIIDMMKQFSEKYRTRGQLKQSNFEY